nr:putative reverse transcriptase, RNA-dependent DNA polymerase, Gag-polypeptide of LTR copia-type [Tanacetum cinerariifolium]
SFEPSTYEEASKDVNWINAMNKEMHALYENDTWDLTDLLVERKPSGSKWVFRIKYMSSGEVESPNDDKEGIHVSSEGSAYQPGSGGDLIQLSSDKQMPHSGLASIIH